MPEQEEKHERLVNPGEWAVTEYVVRALSEQPADALSAESTAEIILAASKKPEISTITPARAKIASITIEHWRQEGEISEEAAKESLDKLKGITTVPGTSGLDLLKLPIEEVTKKARAEMEERLFSTEEQEIEIFLNSATTLERAIYNAGYINSWVDKGTWLKEYMERRSVEVSSESKFRFWRGFNGWGVILRGYGLYDECNLVTTQLLEYIWDRDDTNKYIVNYLSTFDKLRFAQKVFKAIR